MSQEKEKNTNPDNQNVGSQIYGGSVSGQTRSGRIISTGGGNYNERIEGNYIQGNYYNNQSVADAAVEIQKLLEQLDKSYSTDTTLGKMQVATETIKVIENNHTLAQRVTSALKAGGVQALAQLLSHPAASFVIGALEDWQKSKGC